MLQGAFVLMIAGLINRTLGFGLRLVLVRIIGDQGIGLFQMVFPVFITFSILATFGFSVAISKFVSERISQNNYHEILKILKIAVIFAVITGSFFAIILYFNAPFVANKVLNNAKTELLLKAIAPALFFVAIASMFRGFFQGLRMMIPTATSQIVEQITRIIVTLVVIKALLDYQLKYQVTGAALGISAGEGLGLLTLLLIFFKVKTDIIKQIQPTIDIKTNWNLFKELIKFGFPITIGKVVASLIYSLEAILIPAQLQAAGYSVTEATSLYGQLSGMVLQIVHLPTVITVAVTSSLIPAVSEAISANNHKRFQDHYQQALRLTIYTGLPAAVIFFLLPEKICSLLFGYPQAGSILQLFALGAIFLYLLQILKGILQGLGDPNIVVINSIVGLIFEVVLIYFLVSQPDIGLKGAILAITVRFIVIAMLHFVAIYRKVDLTLNLKQLIIKPFLAAGLLAASLTSIYQYFWQLSQNNLLSTFLAVSIGMTGYLAILITTGGITSRDIDRILN
ncbi:stage V sporulation protein B [Acetohalobium arabaticum]|uniref:stage V sporulation protein B n=1 Tax=Acetohalobium arabaticum TaxID=28187 RepID=UPI002479EA94|nr:stage V sporulation protein B [Acetohalobium arabaticum]